jgi:beta-glucosidase
LSETLSLRQKIGQMIVVRGSGYLFDQQRPYPLWEASNSQLERWLRELNLGGVILLGASAGEIYLKTQQLQNWAKTPLLIAADIEEGVGQRFSGATHFPPPMALSEIYQKNPLKAQELAYEMGKVTAQEALAIGVNWVLAPIMDVNNNPHNPVINVRAFGETPEVVSSLGSAFIEGAKNYPVLTTAKHFPGHGDTATDSHLELPTLPHSAQRLAQIEIPPFQSAIQAGVDAVMTAHLLIPAWDQINPATISDQILTEKLRHQLHFSGLIVTDALIMGGVAKYYNQEDLAVKVVEAGADILLMPENPEIAINAIEKAVISGQITEARINESFNRITQAKAQLNFQDQSFPYTEIAQVSAKETVNLILKYSLKQQGNLPIKIKPEVEAINLIYLDSLVNQDILARHTPSVQLPQTLGYQSIFMDEYNLKLTGEINQPFLLQIFLRGNPFRGSAGMSDRLKQYFTGLTEKDNLQGILIYGSPYIFDWFCQEIPPEMPCLFSYGQFDLAQQMMLESLFHIKNLDSQARSSEFI